MSGLASAVVLVTPRSFREASEDAQAQLEREVAEVRYNRRGRPLTSAELRSELRDVDGMVAGVDELDASVFAAAPRLRIVARYGAGVDTIDLDAAARAGVVVTNTPGANAPAVAELTLALALALARRLGLAQRQARRGDWQAVTGVELAGRVVGLLGLGHVGAEAAQRFDAIGCRVLAHDPARDASYAAAVGAQLVALDELVERSRLLSLHAPVTDETRDLVDRRLLGALPEGALLVNTARGELVVEEDLVAALDSGRLAGAALDTLRQEPPPPDHPLLARDDVIVTPHIGAQTAEARTTMARVATAELLAVLAGGKPRFPVNTPLSSTEAR